MDAKKLAESFFIGTQSGQNQPTALEKRFSPGGEFYGNVRRLSAQEKLGLKELPQNHSKVPNIKNAKKVT
jgi:hypothetical protein